ncbi:MAG: CBS domain-containing protein [Woeseiaceae bacterium]
MQIEQSIEVVEVMALDLRAPVVLDESSPLREVIQQLRDANYGCALVTRDGRLAGIFTERDLVTRVLESGHDFDVPVAEWMTANPERVYPTDTIRKAVRLMWRGGFRSVPVVDQDDRVVGCVRHKDIVKYLSEHFAAQVLNLPHDPDRIALNREGG